MARNMQLFVRTLRSALPEAWRASRIWRFLGACVGYGVDIPHKIECHRVLLSRTGRLLLQAAGLPLQRQFLILRCMDREQAVGLFSELSMVLGALEHYERWKQQYAGLRVDFATGGLYYDPAVGPNWWEYYFEPISVGAMSGAAAKPASSAEHDIFESEAGRLPPERRAEIIRQYVRPKAQVRDRVESYVGEHFQGTYVIGIHYRGTDHAESTPPVAYERVRAAVRDAIGRAGPVRCRLFLATDEQAFVDYIQAAFPDRLVYRRMHRSVDGTPIHTRNVDNFGAGEDAVIDCLLLSRCQHLVRTESNLGLCATLFNPDLAQDLLCPPGE